jgi:Transposase DDE domain
MVHNDRDRKEPYNPSPECPLFRCKINERDVLPELVSSYQGVLIADKGLIRPSLTDELAGHYLNLQTPLRSNMHDPRPKSFVNQLMNTRRLIETVIGQLVDRFNVQKIRVKDV